MVVVDLLRYASKLKVVVLKLILFCLFPIVSLPQIAFADNLIKKIINQEPVSLKCTFTHYAMAIYKSNEIEVATYEEENILYIEDIDLDKNSARFIGNAGTDTVHFSVNETGMHFIEITGLGNINLLTVFFNFGEENELKRDIYAAVQSRHLHTVISEPMPGQWYGFCQQWDTQ